MNGDKTPTPDGSETTIQNTDSGVDHEDAVAALRDMLQFYNRRVDDVIADHTETGEHSERPTTAREYFTEVRGWSDDTVDDLLLGWAPGDHVDQLVAYLHERGHSREAMLATGAIGESDSGGLYTTFAGRYVLPYYDADGEPAYAIARCTGGEGGGAKGYGGHPEDYKPGKYAKLRHTDDRVPFEEPIYGLDTLTEGDHVVVAEGIADAITAQETGYAVLSPVTKEFKEAHYDPLVDALESHSVSRVTVVSDADAIYGDAAVDAEPESIAEAAGVLAPTGAGLAGALRTASKLGDRIEAGLRVVLPPAPGDLENDLDEFVTGPWRGDLDALLRSAKPATAFDELEVVTRAAGSAEEATEFDAEEHEPTATEADETTDDIHDIYHALDRLDAQRVADDTIVSEWLEAPQENRAFRPTWASSDYTGTAVFANSEVFKDVGGRGGKGGPAVMAAIDAGLVRDTQTPEAVEGETWVRAVDHLRDLGYSIPGLEVSTDNSEDCEPEAALPLERLNALNREEARRYASKRGVEWPTTRDARERLRNDIMETMHHGDMKIIDAPTALGKSYIVATEPWLRRSSTTGEAPVVQFSETREARDQAAAHSADAGVQTATLLGRTEACPVAGGDHDPVEDDEKAPDTVLTMHGQPASEWFESVCEGKGIPFSVAHQHLDEHNDQDADLPCCAGEGQCPAIAQWEGLPRTDEGDPAVDVIHATHGFAHVPSLRNGTNMVFDEEPDFRENLSHERIRRAVAAYLKVAEAPVSDFERFVAKARRGEDEEANEHSKNGYLRDALDYEPEREWYLEADGAHTLAPALTKAIYYALRPEEGGVEADASDANGRYNATVGHEPPRLDKEANDDEGWNRVWVSVVLDADNTVRTVRSTPDTMAARSVIGLDAHPCVEKWQRNAHPDIMPQPVLNPDERRLWRRYERGLTVVGVGDATRPLTSGEYFDEDGTHAFLEAIREHHGDRFRTAITANSVEHRTEEILREIGVDEPDTMHYGEEKSRGDFGDEDVGALNGCIDPGDEFVLDLLAEAGLDATPETRENDDGEEYRAKGRGFEGPDAGAAERLLASVRENHVAQAAGRYARNADDADDEAVVYVRTDAAPEGYLDLTVPGVEWLATDRQREIIAELRQRPSATTREIAEATDTTKEHVRQTLNRLHEEELVECREHAGEHGAHLYRAMAGLAEGDLVDLTPDTTNDGVCNSYTWSLAVSRPDTVFRTPAPAVTSGEPASTPDKPSKQRGLGADTNDDPPN